MDFSAVTAEETSGKNGNKSKLCMCLSSLQETEEDLAEAEEYKEAKNMLDSVKLEG